MTTPTYEELIVKADRLQAINGQLQIAIKLLLDNVDYTNSACSVTEMVGAVLDIAIIEKAHAAIAAARI